MTATVSPVEGYDPKDLKQVVVQVAWTPRYRQKKGGVVKLVTFFAPTQ